MDESFFFVANILVVSEVEFLTMQIRPPQKERFTQILSIGIGGSALGPQFVAEALAPDNPPLKVYSKHNLLCIRMLSNIFHEQLVFPWLSHFNFHNYHLWWNLLICMLYLLQGNGILLETSELIHFFLKVPHVSCFIWGVWGGEHAFIFLHIHAWLWATKIMKKIRVII